MQLPYFTADLPGIGGRLKDHLEDFVVDELPLYEPAGVGEHCYFTIEKRGFSTMQALGHAARALGRRSMDFGYAGLKDTRAVTRQQFSIEHEPSDRITKMELPTGLKIVHVTRHRNKLKIGHLAGNRFSIKVRHEDWSRTGGSVGPAMERARHILDRLEKTGVPNFFGPQRFGMRKDNHLLGLALLRGDHQGFLNLWLGNPDEQVDTGAVLQSRRHFAGGRLDLAAANWPGHLAEERKVLRMLAQKPDSPQRAVRAVDVRLKRLLVCALQAFLFNEVLARRLPQFTRVLPGDLAWLHDKGAVFAVEPDAVEAAQVRADTHEISPSGPMFGYRMTQPQLEPLQMEDAVLAANELTAADFEKPQAEKTKGGRRAMRFFARHTQLGSGADERGPFLRLGFELPPGCFATVLLGEIMKVDVPVD